jgi:hypothetical protein
VDGNFIACENLPWIEEWEVAVLVFRNTTIVREAMLDAFD